MIPAEARDIFYYYAGAVLLALLIFARAGRRRKGMRLKLKGGGAPPRASAGASENVINISGHQTQSPEKFSHIQPGGERPLNVVFNYNGHSWDAYEVIGLPAGSSPEKVELAYREAIGSVDPGSRSFMEAAYHAIQSEWKAYKSTGTRR